MKFDFAIGNPPYQEQSGGEKISDASIYNFFMDAAYSVAGKVELITPARFLFDNGNTPTDWNKKMLSDKHFKVLDFEPVSTKVFANKNIMGGIAIHYRDIDKCFGAIAHFTPFIALNNILKKVRLLQEPSLTAIIYNQNKFNLDNIYRDYPELRNVISSEGNEKRLTSSCINYPCFHDEKQRGDIKVIGIDGNNSNKRICKFISQKYIEKGHENTDKYKVIVPANNGAPAIGRKENTSIIGVPILGVPTLCFTQSFISIGAYTSKREAENALKYVKSKFCRVLIGILKVTQNGKRPVWNFVPQQKFSSMSSIDWSKSVKDIDRQLYAKYGLSDEEIAFIESNVKEMA